MFHQHFPSICLMCPPPPPPPFIAHPQSQPLHGAHQYIMSNGRGGEQILARYCSQFYHWTLGRPASNWEFLPENSTFKIFALHLIERKKQERLLFVCTKCRICFGTACYLYFSTANLISQRCPGFCKIPTEPFFAMSFYNEYINANDFFCQNQGTAFRQLVSSMFPVLILLLRGDLFFHKISTKPLFLHNVLAKKNEIFPLVHQH